MNTPHDLFHRTVKVKRCLVAKPRHSASKWGWIVEGSERDPDQTEPCGAVGKMVGLILSDDVVAVSFVDPWPLAYSGQGYRETLLYARLNDCEVTDEAYSWPEQEGMTVLKYPDTQQPPE